MNRSSLTKTALFRSSPSLALIKYWGKEDSPRNIPATSSLAVNLDGLYTETKVAFGEGEDKVQVNGQEMPPLRYVKFFDEVRSRLNVKTYFDVESRTNFPVAAGIASSSSGFASLALGCTKLLKEDVGQKEISEMARVGSASAARAVFGGFTTLKKGALSAEPLPLECSWDNLRVLIVIVNQGAKEISSREAMERAKENSPYYSSWIEDSENIFSEALRAFQKKDLNALGTCMRVSYLGMFGTMFTSKPAVMYWYPDTVGIIRLCQELRQDGIGAWETMDAGPQVKILCEKDHLDNIQRTVNSAFPQLECLISKPGGAPLQLDKFSIQ